MSSQDREQAVCLPLIRTKVLTQIPKPVAEPTVPVIKTSEIDLYSQGEELQTPISLMSLTSLHIQIRQDAYANNKASKQCVLRETQKLINVIETSYVKCVI